MTSLWVVIDDKYVQRSAAAGLLSWCGMWVSHLKNSLVQCSSDRLL